MNKKEILGNINSVESMGLVDGPGIRYVVFLQGCKLRCLYCHNPETWNVSAKVQRTTPSALVKKIERFKSYFGTDGGVTFSGGEPLLQPEFLIECLKLCKNVLLKDLSMLMCGHFALLATGVDNLTILNVTVDTNRDGFDIDCCKNVRISQCTVNTPWDDAIVLKASYALGYFKDTENVTISDCFVSGYDRGTVLDCTWQRDEPQAPDHGFVTGRIKLGTESSGGFKNIAITNCIFERCRGLALETVDGGRLEDVVVSNITMRDIVNAPIFLRLGARMRSPEGTPVGTMKRIRISNINVYNADSRYSSIISGIPGARIEDVSLSNIHIYYQGGYTEEDGKRIPPEEEKTYPEPWMFGTIPAKGFFIRHAQGVTLDGIHFHYEKPDGRPLFVTDDAAPTYRNITVDGEDYRDVGKGK